MEEKEEEEEEEVPRAEAPCVRMAFEQTREGCRTIGNEIECICWDQQSGDDCGAGKKDKWTRNPRVEERKKKKEEGREKKGQQGKDEMLGDRRADPAFGGGGLKNGRMRRHWTD